MRRIGMKHGRDKDSVARPKLIDPIERSVVLSNDKDHVLSVVDGNAYQPIVEKRQVRLAHNADNDRTVFGDKGECLLECIMSPFGS